MPYWSYRIDAQGHVAKYETSKEKDGSYLVETTTHYRSDDFDRSVGVWSHDASKAFADDISEMMGFHEVEEIKLKPEKSLRTSRSAPWDSWPLPVSSQSFWQPS